MTRIGSVDERYQSYNVEMAEVIGGNFWKPYDTQNTDKMKTNPDTSSSKSKGFQIGSNDTSMFQSRPPVDLSKACLRMLAKALGPVYIRVSGTWANSVYFHDSDAPSAKTLPKGFQGVLTRQEWKGVVDFSKAVNAKIITSFAISQGFATLLAFGQRFRRRKFLITQSHRGRETR